MCLRGLSVIKTEKCFQRNLKANGPYQESGLPKKIKIVIGGENVDKSTLNTSACVLQPVEKNLGTPFLFTERREIF